MRLSMFISIHVGMRYLCLCQSMRVAWYHVASTQLKFSGSTQLKFSRGRAGSLSLWVGGLSSQVSSWIVGHRFIMMPQITSQNYKALG
jgi:hypothetical protein